MFSNLFLFLNRAVYEIRRKNIVEPGRQQMAVWRMRIARWIPKATHTHTHTYSQNMQYSLLFYYNNGYANAP